MSSWLRRTAVKCSWNRYLSDGLKGVQSLSIVKDAKNPSVDLNWKDGHKSSFSLAWLRDHGQECYHPSTRQRETDTYLTSRNFPAAKTAKIEGDELVVDYKETVNDIKYSKKIPLSWLREQCPSETARQLRTEHICNNSGYSRKHWGSNVLSTDGDKPVTLHADVMNENDGLKHLMEMLRVYGIALVTNCPLDIKSTEALCRRIGVIRETMYGGMWEVSNYGKALNDSSYTNDALGSHTDCTYMIDPPGLQVFTCLEAASEGGESTYVDGFAVADWIKNEHPDAFEFLKTAVFSYFSYDAGYHFRAAGPIFSTGIGGRVIQVRHNDYDRAPLDFLSSSEIDDFYEYHAILTEKIRNEEMILRYGLRPGDTILIDNHRILHGRESFVGRRKLCGCYISRDDVESRMRDLGMEVYPEYM